jgi:hypothetical protein
LPQQLEQLVECGPLAHRDVENLSLHLIRRQCRKQIGLHRISHEAEIAAGLAVAVDDDPLASSMESTQRGITAA